MVDQFMKWFETRPLKRKETLEVAREVFSIYCNIGDSEDPQLTLETTQTITIRY